MKKYLSIFALLFVLASCDFQSREDFEKEVNRKQEVSEDFVMPKITYVPADPIENPVDGEEGAKEESDDDLNLAERYGNGKVGKNQNPNDIRGNIIDSDIFDTQIGISIVPSIQTPGGYSTLLTYRRNNELVEREFGPIAGFEGLNSTVTYDVVESESGPMLLVSQVSIIGNHTYSAYYLFNRYMSLIDYLVFRNSTEQIMPTIERLGEIVEYTDRAYTGILSQAVDRRMKAEKRYLPSMFDVYGIKYRPIVAIIEDKDIDIGYLPDTKRENRLLIVKTSYNPINPGAYVDVERN